MCVLNVITFFTCSNVILLLSMCYSGLADYLASISFSPQENIFEKLFWETLEIIAWLIKRELMVIFYVHTICLHVHLLLLIYYTCFDDVHESFSILPSKILFQNLFGENRKDDMTMHQVRGSLTIVICSYRVPLFYFVSCMKVFFTYYI